MADRLPSWNDTATRAAIVGYVESIGDIPPEERVAVFDNDGTLWCEKPMQVEVGFILRRLAEMAAAEESLRAVQPWQAAHEQDYAWLSGAITKHYHGDDGDMNVLMGGILQAFRGMSVEEYAAAADAYLQQANHPTLGRPLRDCGYLPMVELLRYLEANGFTNYIASGGDRDFMRCVTDAISLPSGLWAARTPCATWRTNTAAASSTAHSRTCSTTARPNRSASGAGSGGAPWRPPAIRTATSRCCSSRAGAHARRCACSSCTTTPTASSTMSPARNVLSNRPPRRGGRS
jgi:phosphoglycolate phosphatase-like HAD superfamily hydrolase